MNKEVYIKDIENLNKLIDKFKKDTYKQLHIVSDFDRTLTKAFHEGQKAHTALAQIREGGYLTQDYLSKAYELFDKYYPIEISKDIAQEEKEEKMIEWWTSHLNLLVEKGMNKNVINNIIKKDKIQLREGITDFFNILSNYKIPLLILSAGSGSIIEELLKSKGKLNNDIHIISNFFVFNKMGKVIGYRNKIIHTFNKKEVEIKNSSYYNEIKQRKNVILLGDVIADIDMVKGIEYNNIIKIGFLNDKIEDQLEEYSENFDIVILNDGNMDYINKLLKKLK